ncbi:MAG: SSI family serine proteinase inhibitor [Blastococcus sp.]
MRLLLLLALLSLTACASPGGGGAAAPTSDPAAGGGTTQADNDLQVTYDLGDGTEPQTWALSCLGGGSGSHPDAAAACAHLQTLEDPFAPIPADAVCTEQFGGPQTAHLIGRWAGESVDLHLSRVDGCHMSQWDALVPLVPEMEPAG